MRASQKNFRRTDPQQKKSWMDENIAEELQTDGPTAEKILNEWEHRRRTSDRRAHSRRSSEVTSSHVSQKKKLNTNNLAEGTPYEQTVKANLSHREPCKVKGKTQRKELQTNIWTYKVFGRDGHLTMNQWVCTVQSGMHNTTGCYQLYETMAQPTTDYAPTGWAKALENLFLRFLITNWQQRCNDGPKQTHNTWKKQD